MARKPTFHGVFLLLLGLTFGACSSSPSEPEPFDIDEVEFAEELGVDLASMSMTESGVYYEDREEGDGTLVEDGGTVESWDYILWLPDGTLLQDSRDASQELPTFTVGDGDLIPGFEEGVQGMLAGGTRLLVIPPDLAYGEQGSGPIPPNSAVVFEVVITEASPPPA